MVIYEIIRLNQSFYAANKLHKLLPYLKIDESIIKKAEADETNLLEDYFRIFENRLVPVMDNLRNDELDNITWLNYQHLCSFAALQLIRTN